MGVIANPVLLLVLEWLEWISYHSASRCIGLAPGIVEGIERRGIAANRIELIPNGSDIDVFRPALAPGRHLGLPDAIRGSDFVAMFMGAHGIANGLDSALDAAAEIKRRGRLDVQLVFVGEGRMKPDLQRRAETEDLPVHFLDPLPKSQLAEILSGVDAGLMILANVSAFYYGTSPNKFFDYIAAGVPVINNYPGWLADLITSHECGIVVPPGEPYAFADALEALADDRHATRRMGDNARQLAVNEFDRAVLSQRFAEVIEAAR
jgi:glycosyltransferase involved in cell wall biosynthesis